jgi:hypothetical protein
MAFAIEALEYHYHFGTDERNDAMRTMMRTVRNTVFVRLPEGLQRPIPGGCQCQWCNAHPLLVPKWDTLAVCKDGKGNSWTVHYPDISDDSNGAIHLNMGGLHATL